MIYSYLDYIIWRFGIDCCEKSLTLTSPLLLTLVQAVGRLHKISHPTGSIVVVAFPPPSNRSFGFGGAKLVNRRTHKQDKKGSSRWRQTLSLSLSLFNNTHRRAFYERTRHEQSTGLDARQQR
jgi:hypothetical protein